MENQNKFNITEFANTANVSERTVRYYVKENLIDPPEGDRRGSFYTIKHLDQIKEVIKLKDDLTINEIKEEKSDEIRFSLSSSKESFSNYESYQNYTNKKADEISNIVTLCILIFIIVCILISWLAGC